MHKLNRYLILILMTTVILMPVTAKADNPNVYIQDDADLLTDQEEADLREYLETLNPEVNYVAATSESEEYGTDTHDMLRGYYTQKYDTSEDGIAFIIDMYNREVYISGYGDAKKWISNADCLDITDNIYNYASYEEYYTCMVKAFQQADILVNKGFILRPMRFIVSALVAIVLGFLGTFIFAISGRATSQSASDKAVAALMAGATIAGTAVVFDSRKTKHQSSGSSSSGGGWDSGGGGGGFSGGSDSSGGGHSF